ncbi:hypothetical protein HII31_02726 [Pseudocercospora fuligena]|uniref:Uncharacterized protein n=1 Tax=Pseudocercospora fuligena TaxID=685502 RepID=A0A8H6RRN5_9PEZI|nr:hypothetical protein HII31_02726 [Pseudocercospora fuligena]
MSSNEALASSLEAKSSNRKRSQSDTVSTSRSSSWVPTDDTSSYDSTIEDSVNSNEPVKKRARTYSQESWVPSDDTGSCNSIIQDSVNSNEPVNKRARKRAPKKARTYPTSPSNYPSPSYFAKFDLSIWSRRQCKLPSADSFPSAASMYSRTAIIYLASLVFRQSSEEAPKDSKGFLSLQLLYTEIKNFAWHFHIDNDLIVVAMMLLSRRGTKPNDDPFRSFVIAIILAEKVLDDVGPHQKRRARYLRVDPRVLTDLEYKFCTEIDWKLGVGEDDWMWWVGELGTLRALRSEPTDMESVVKSMKAFLGMDNGTKMDALVETDLTGEIMEQIELWTWVKGLFPRYS